MSANVLTCEFDRAVIAEDAAFDPWDADSAVLRRTYFVLPCRFVVAGTDMLELSSGRRKPLPVLGLALGLCDAVERLGHERTSSCEFADASELTFERDLQVVVVRTDIHEASSVAELRELQSATRQFALDVRAWIERLIPRMGTHAQWNGNLAP